jgi:hypothetical protein
VHTGFWWENLRERDDLEDPGVTWEDNIKMSIQEVGWGHMDWIDFVQNRNRWRAVVNVVMNLLVP